jgi:hypothetical protein
METTTTRIVDLPEATNTIQPMFSQQQQQPSIKEQPTNYTQMNIHPNPYGNDIPSHFPTPQMQPPKNNMFSQDDIPQQRLPSRDIPMDSTGYLQDEQIRANYIPKQPSHTIDYVREYESVTEKKKEKHLQENWRVHLLDRFLEKLQIPVLVSLLFFFFNMSFFELSFMKYLSFLPIYNDGGVLNTNGLLLKSFFFGFGFFSLLQAIDFLAND